MSPASCHTWTITPTSQERHAAEHEAATAAEATRENSVFEETIETKSEPVSKDSLAVNANVEPSKESKSEEDLKKTYY